MFRQDFTCPALLKSCNHPDPYGAVTRLPDFPDGSVKIMQALAYPRSLATTNGVSIDVLSSGYLDVSVPWVP